MKTYPTARIRNVALVGHNGAGKTSLAEALLFATGAIPRMGRVEDANTVCDFDPEEQRRSMSLRLALAPVEFADHKINLLDTPGYADFVGDVAAALSVADLALFVVSAVEGIEVQTEIAWRMAEERGLPRAVFVTKLDRERASFDRTLDQLKERFGQGIAPLQLPIGEEAAFTGVVELLTDTAYTYAGAADGTPGTVPDDMAIAEHDVHDHLVEGIVVGDDDLMERYLDEQPIEIEALARALAQGVASGQVYPVLCGSPTKLVGIDRLAHFLVEEAPAPAEAPGAPGAVVFRTMVDQYVGHVNLFKVTSGSVGVDAHLANARTGKDERLHQIFVLRGKEHQATAELATGDIAAVAKLADTTTGDVLGDPAGAFDLIAAPEPLLAVAVVAHAKNDEDKLANALARLAQEDAVLRVERDPETHQTLIWGMGETHLNLALATLAGKFGVAVDTEPIRVPYRETVSATAEAEGRLKKQSGGHGQYAVAWLRVEPRERGAGVEFAESIVGGVIPRQFLPAVEKGVLETAARAGTLGYPVVDVRVTCFDGKHHPVDSSEMAFKTAASIGVKEALAKAGPQLLEPVSELVVVAPESLQGDVMGDLNARRGRIQGSVAIGDGEVEITAHVPAAEAQRYAIDLRSLTHGRGRFTRRHSHYDPVPAHLVDALTTGR